jgi:hypothetical protein
MNVTEYRIRDYAAEHHRLPARLSDLPKLENPNRDGSCRDGWGRELIYAPQSDGSVVLSSLGKNGRLGGKGAMVRRFTVEDAKASSVTRPE